MKIPLQFYDQIRSTLRVSDIVRQKLVLTRKGNEYLGICPFHDEKTPSFTVNDAKRFYHCFGCSAHGDVIRFVSEIDGISYKEAAVKIAGDNGIELPKMSAAQAQEYEKSDYIHTILELAAQFFISNMNDDCKKYLMNRGLDQEIITSFSIGYAPGGGALERYFKEKSIPAKDLLMAGLVGRKEDGRIYEIFNKRIMFPIKNVYNKIVGFGGRSIGDNMPKYINSPETIVFKKGEIMYGENVATGRAYKDNYSIIVEGYMDVIALHQAGYKQAVASLGTSVTDKHIQKLWRSGDEIIICLDGDNAGVRASNRLIEMSLPHITATKLISFVELPSGFDPDDLIKSKGTSSFKELITKRLGLSEMIWKKEYEGKSFKTAELRARLEQKLNSYCNLIENRSLQANFRRYFKDMVWNNLIRHKSAKLDNQKILNKEITTIKKYSEIEVVEHSICSFLLQNYKIAISPEIKDLLYNVNIQDENLNDFKNWILDTEFLEEGDLQEGIESIIKNTGFYDTYLVLSNPDIMFLNPGFLSKNGVDLKQVFDWLCKKHYLLLLKQEYMNISKDDLGKAQLKSVSYLKEIRKISIELDQLSDSFIHNH